MRKTAVFLALVATALFALASAAGANTGSVTSQQSCSGWSASVTLHSDVSLSHWVQVTSTIPGTPNVAKEHAKGPQTLWSQSGTTQTTGSVTLTIYFPNGTTVERQYTTTLPPIVQCETTTVAPTTTTVPETTSTTSPPKDTTTLFVTTSTTAPPVVTTVPPPGVTTTTAACTPGVPPCAYTGSNTKTPLTAAAVLMVSGGALVWSTRKRKVAR